jgi:hypothetical protein
MDKRLRVVLIATGILIIPQIGLFMAVRDLNTSGHTSPLAFLFLIIGVFTVPTSVILSGAIVASVWRKWREHQPIVMLGVVNTLIALNIIVFVANQCVWAAVFNVGIKSCIR